MWLPVVVCSCGNDATVRTTGQTATTATGQTAVTSSTPVTQPTNAADVVTTSRVTVDAPPPDDPASPADPTRAVPEITPASLTIDDLPPPPPPKKDNPLAGCTMCHVDVEDEYVPSKHYAEKVSCKRCHGKSEGHLADENNEVKPDRMFTRANTDDFCEECHECGREPPEPPDLPAAEHKICTECHGAHDVKLATADGQSG